jgi:hypothetical protein
MINGYVGDDETFDRAIARFAEAYAHRNDQDHAEMLVAVEDGQVRVVSDASSRRPNAPSRPRRTPPQRAERPGPRGPGRSLRRCAW